MSAPSWQAVLLDFDGVILESNAARTDGFRRLFAGHPRPAVDRLIAYHEENGGLSRYHKIEYFFREILGRAISPPERDEHALRFSSLVKQAVIDSPFVPGAREFLDRRHPFPLFLVSGSDQAELRDICAALGISARFSGIYGSPTPKTVNVARLLSEGGFEPPRTVLIGDSRNDKEAAVSNGARFIARAPAGAGWAAGSPRIDDLRGLDDALERAARGAV